MKEYISSSVVDEAVKFAVEAHHNQKRNGHDIPYIVHPLEAMAIVATMSEDEELLAAAVMHDVIEDTIYTYEDIEKRFNKRIADIVQAESDITVFDSDALTNWLARKKVAIEKLKNAPIEVQIVALGDKLSNMRAMYRDYQVVKDELWNRFHVKDFEMHKWRYNELVKAFDKVTDFIAYKEFAYLVNEVFNKKE